MSSFKHILITGGAGFIGRHLTALLQHQGCKVRWLDCLDPQIHGETAVRNPHYCRDADEMILGDVRRREDWQKALRDVEAVVHLAAQTGTGQSMYRVAYYTDVNVGGTALLWDILAEGSSAVQKVIVASSRAIYGEGLYQCQGGCGLVMAQSRTKAELQVGHWKPACPTCGGPARPMATPETATPAPVSLYACTKLAQEQMSLTMGKAQGIPVAALRFQNVYGPGQSLRNPYTGILSIFSNQLHQNLPVNIHEDGTESRDFVFVEDVARACMRAMELKDLNVVVNVGSGQPTAVLELARLLKQHWRSESPVTVTGDFRVGDIRHNWADLTRLYHLWPDWNITHLDAGLAQFVAWAREQAVFEDKTRGAVQELKSRNLAMRKNDPLTLPTSVSYKAGRT